MKALLLALAKTKKVCSVDESLEQSPSCWRKISEMKLKFFVRKRELVLLQLLPVLILLLINSA